MTQIDLSHAIAATGDEWQKPGVRVVDPVTGIAFRMRAQVYRIAELSADWRRFITDEQPDSAPMVFDIQSCTDRAIAAGPDWQDDATAGVLLGLMPDARLDVWDNMWTGRSWTCWPEIGKNGVSGKTRNEAIARAYVASKGAM